MSMTCKEFDDLHRAKHPTINELPDPIDDPTILAKALGLLDDCSDLMQALVDPSNGRTIPGDLNRELIRIEFTVKQFLSEWGIIEDINR